MIKFSIESPKLLSLSEQLERLTQKKNRSPRQLTSKTFIQNYEINIQMILLTLIDSFFVIQQNSHLNLALAKLALESAVTIAVVIFRNRLSLPFKKISLALIKILVQTQLILDNDDQALFVVILIVVKTQIKYQYKLDGLLNIIVYSIALIFCAIFYGQLILTVCLGSVILIEIYQSYVSYKLSFGLKNRNQCMMESLKIHDDIWKNRIQLIPIPIILVSKNDCNITFRNNTTFEHFKDFCDQSISVDTFILFQLQFSIIQDNLEQIYGSTINFYKKTPLTSRLNSYQLIGDVEIFQKNNLKSLLENFKQGMYTTYMENNKFGSLEIVCQQVLENGKQVQLSGRIMCNDEDKEFIVILNDTSKQNEFQQYIVRDEFKTKMIESFSHELRTPLNSAINFLTTVQPIVDEDVKDTFIQPALNALRLQSYLINDVIDFSQYYNHTIELKIKEINLSELIGEITTLFEQQFSLKKVGFKIIIDDNCVDKINSDYTRLMQILVNLLQNSLKFTRQGTTILTISSPQDYMIKLTIQDTGIGINSDTLEQIKNYCANIKSHSNFNALKTWNGFGLIISTILLNQLAPSEHKQFHIKSIEQPRGTKVSFYISNIQAPSSNTILRSQKFKNQFNEVKGATIIVSNQFQSSSKKRFGTSKCSLKSYEEQSDLQSNSFIKPEINLQTICQLQPLLITELNNVCFNDKRSAAWSKQSKEKEIGIDVFRAKECEVVEERRKKLLQNLKCSCRRILSVDDEIFNQTSIQFLLSRIGFEVIIAFNGEEAIQIISSLELCSQSCNPFALILMDYQMPIMDGIEATKRIKKLMYDGLIPATHIVGLTAFTSRLHIKKCLEAGMSQVLSKPLNMTEFEQILESL